MGTIEGKNTMIKPKRTLNFLSAMILLTVLLLAILASSKITSWATRLSREGLISQSTAADNHPKTIPNLDQKSQTAVPNVNNQPVEKSSSNPVPTKVDLPDLGAAPGLTGINHWINGDPLSLQDLQGKVVLVDFWTFDCINCIHTLPYVTAWYNKYKDQGFIVIGVHTPEFSFEHDTNNVIQAAKQYKIDYPIAQDNDYATWKAYKNRYWPAEYLIDANGHLRLVYFGEGNYDQTEKAIQELITEADAAKQGGVKN
jgi:thiol-disulfide isomerase/thioredoxin